MIQVTGYMFNYYHICKRKLWLSAHKINMESESDLVNMGKLLDGSTYLREKHNCKIEDIASIDFLKNNIVHEVKKSNAHTEAAVWQVKFYLYHLHIRGHEGLIGRIDFPLQRRSQEVRLQPEDLDIIPQKISEIQEIIACSAPPKPSNYRGYKNSAYYDFDMI